MTDVTALAIIAELTVLLESENLALDRMDVAPVVASLGRKRTLVEELVARSSARAGKSTSGKGNDERFLAAVRRNSTLLDSAMHGQRELLKILASAVCDAEERRIYVRRGHSTRLTHSTGLTIATSA